MSCCLSWEGEEGGIGFEIWKQEAEGQHVWVAGPLGGGHGREGLPGIPSHGDCWVLLTESEALRAGDWLVLLISVPRTQNSAQVMNGIQ